MLSVLYGFSLHTFQSFPLISKQTSQALFTPVHDSDACFETSEILLWRKIARRTLTEQETDFGQRLYCVRIISGIVYVYGHTIQFFVNSYGLLFHLLFCC